MSATVNFCLQCRARLEVVREPGQHVGQAPALRAGRDQAAIEGRERARKPRERRGQRLAGLDVAAQRRHELRGARRIGLLRDRGERLVHGQPRLRERRPLPGEERELPCRQAGRRERVERRATFAHVDRGQTLCAQPVARAARAVGVDAPARDASLRIDRFVVPGGHRRRARSSARRRASRGRARRARSCRRRASARHPHAGRSSPPRAPRRAGSPPTRGRGCAAAASRPRP